MIDTKKLLTKILDALKYDYIVETGTSGGWDYRKWKSGRMEAEKNLSTGSSWTTVSSLSLWHNTTTITPPTGMTVTGGYTSLQTLSAYIVNTQVQVGATINLEAHRLASGSASFTVKVCLIGTY